MEEENKEKMGATEAINKYKEIVMVTTEIRDQLDKGSKLMSENLDILNDPIRLMVEGDKLNENWTKMQLCFFALNNFLTAVGNKDKQEDDE